LNRALELNPELAEAYAGRGYLSMDAGDCERALPDFEKARALNPDLVEALHWNSLCLKKMGRLREAMQLEQRAHRLDPLHAAVFAGLYVYKLTYGMEVELNLDAARRNNPERYIDYRESILFSQKAWADIFNLSRERTNADAALATETGATALLRQHDEVLFARIAKPNAKPNHDLYLLTLYVFEQFARAEKYLVELDDSDLNWLDHDGWLGLIKYRAGALAEAETLLTRSVSGDYAHWVNPSFITSYLNLTISLADTLQRAGRNESAATFLDEARASIENLKHNGARADYQLPEARLSILEGNINEALPLLRAADNSGGIIWDDFNDPIIVRLAENPEFIAFKAEYYAHLNAERAKLGWPPVAENK
jgi:tetratricopeptide (TPR) repeat protein